MLTKDIESSLLVLPADVPGLQTMVLELNEKMDEVVKNHELESHLLRERIRQLEHQLYGRKSEKLALYDGFEQSCLFDSDEATQSLLAEPKSEVEITIPSHKRKKGGRKDLPADLERVEVVHDISQSEKQCGCGSEMSRIGEEVSEQLEMVPAHFWVVRHIRPKYACKHCEGVEGNEDERSVKIAPVPPQLLPKTISTPGLLSHIFVSKFCDSLPFYRQEKQFKRLGFELSRGTMCNWAIKVADRCNRLVELLRQEILSGPLINIDETTFQVLRERTPGRRVDSKSYMWVKRGGLPGKEGVVYHYAENRSGSVASDLVGAYRGYVQTDGYSGYDFLDHRDGIIHVGCWAHVRRKFLDVLKASGVKNVKRVKHKLKDLGHAGKALQTIRDLYAIEKEAIEQELTAELVYEERRRKAKPILDDFEIWLKEIAPTAPPKSLLGKALAYTLGQWHRLIRYLDDGIIRMDNNLAENAIRPFVISCLSRFFHENSNVNDRCVCLSVFFLAIRSHFLPVPVFSKLLFVVKKEIFFQFLSQSKLFADSGKPFADRGKAFTVPEKPFAGRGEAFAASEKPFAGRGEAFAVSEKPFTAQGGPFTVPEKQFTGRGGPFAASEKPFANRGRPFAASRKPFADRSGPFEASRKPFADRGGPFAASRKSFTDRGGQFADQSGPFEAPGKIKQNKVPGKKVVYRPDPFLP